MRIKTIVRVMLAVVMCLTTLAACNGGGGGGDGNMPGPPGTLQLLETSFDATEGTVVNILVARSGGNSGVVSVDYATADGTAAGGSDYPAANGTLTWPDGTSGNLTISIPITDDDTVEPPESFTVTLSNVSVASLGANTSATVNIIDNDVEVIILPTYGYQISATPAAGPLTVTFPGDGGMFGISVDFGNTLNGDVNINVDVDNQVSIIDFTVQSLSSLAVDTNVGLPFLGAFDIEVIEDMQFDVGSPPTTGVLQISTATETVTLQAFIDGVELRLEGGMPVQYTWEELDSLFDDELLPEWQRRAAFGAAVLEFVIDQTLSVTEVFNFIDDQLATVNPLIAACDAFTGSPPAGVIPQGESTFTWMGSGPTPMGGDDFRWLFTDCWIDDVSNFDDTLLNGSIDLRDYIEIIDAQSRLIGTGFDEVIYNDFEIADTTENPPGTFTIDPSNRITINGGFDLAIIGN